MTQWTRKRDAGIELSQFEELRDADPLGQLEWVWENVDPDAVGVEGMTMTATPDEPVECFVTYYVPRFREVAGGG